MLVGLAIIAYGANQIRIAYTEKFREKIARRGKRGGKAGNAYVYFGKAGYTAKGIAIGIVGVLFVYAGITHEAKKSGGIDQALHEVLEQPFGPFLLGRLRSASSATACSASPGPGTTPASSPCLPHPRAASRRDLTSSGASSASMTCHDA